MQPVNVLPTFVSQDADSKAKESLGSNNKDTDFARLVDKHVENENKDSSRKESALHTENSAAMKGNTVATNGKNDTNDQRNEQGSRQESDSQHQTPDSKLNNKRNDGDLHQQGDEVLVDENGKSIEKGSKKDNENEADDEALSASEQFMSLLFNSDKTLTNTDETMKKAGQSGQTANTISQQAISNSKVDAAGNSAVKDDVTVSNVDENGLISDKESQESTKEHSLKAFSKEELLARAQLKGLNAADKSSDQALKDYQLSLQSKQDSVTNKSITSEQLLNAQLAIAALKKHKASDVTAAVMPVNKVLLKEKVDSGNYQLPVEPIDKGKPAGDELEVVTDELASKVSEKESKKQNISSLAAKPQSDVSAKLTAELNTVPVTPSEKAASSDAEIKIANTPLAKGSTEKVVFERTAQSIILNDAISKEQPAESQLKQPAMTSAQVQALQLVQAQQKEQIANNELHATGDSDDEYSYEDAIQLSQDLPKDQGLNKGNKIVDNVATRSVSEVQAQAIQANQIKQNNDAYVEHQSAEVLSHNVASDTAQIQKNNVQLQQETISIFKKDFAEAVKDKVLVTINQKLQQLDITLDPPEFGNMQVRVNLQGEQAAVSFVVQNQQAKEALEQNMHKLKEMLAEQGVDVGGANVEQQNQQEKNDENALASDNSSRLTNQGEEEHNVEHTLSASLFDSSATGVDYYA